MIDEMPWEQPFLAALAELGIIKHAAKAVGVGRTTVETRRRKSPNFGRRIAEALPPKEERQALIDRTKRPRFSKPRSSIFQMPTRTPWQQFNSAWRDRITRPAGTVNPWRAWRRPWRSPSDGLMFVP